MRRDYATKTAGSARAALAEAPKAIEDAACNVSERLHDLREQASDRAVQYYNQGRRSLRRSAEDLQDVVAERPLRSTLVALGIGCLLCACLIRR